MTTSTNKDDVLTLLIHLGYSGFERITTEEGADMEEGVVCIPNREILEAFKTSADF